MLRLVLGTFAYLLLASAFALLVTDGMRSYDSTTLTLTSVEDAAVTVLDANLASLRTSIESRAHPLLWDPVLVSLLRLPAFLLLAVGALVLFRLTRPRRRG